MGPRREARPVSFPTAAFDQKLLNRYETTEKVKLESVPAAAEAPSAAWRASMSAQPASAARLFGDRALWTLFALGLAIGSPVGSGWYELPGWLGYPGGRQSHSLGWVTLSSIGPTLVLTLLIAPFLDRARAIGIGRLGHRRSWVLLGAGAALLAYRVSPMRAFVHLQRFVIALAALYLACRLALGFTPLAMSVLVVATYLVGAAAFVIYATVAAALTAPPHTAGHYALLGLFAALFWLGDTILERLAPFVGTSALAAGAMVCALAAIGGMYVARRMAGPRPASRDASAAAEPGTVS
jgi:hypothetical protein